MIETQNRGRAAKAAARGRDSEIRSEARHLKAAAQRSREKAEQLAAKNKPARDRKLPMHDHDGRAKRQLAKLTGNDGWAVQQSAALAKRAGKAEARRAGLSIRKEYEMGFWLEGSTCSTRNLVLSVPAGELPLGEGRRLVTGGGVTVNEQKITDPQMMLTKDDFSGELIVKKGKKVFHKFILQ